MSEQTPYERFVQRYESKQLPWDDALPPPEVVTLVQTLPPGKALDLGCGYGRTAIYLARQGWQVDGIDFVEQAIIEAQARAQAAGVTDQINFYQASVTALNFLKRPYDLAIDIGCLHSLNQDTMLTAYRDELVRLLRSGASYLLFARLRQSPNEEGASGLPEATFKALFANDFRLDRLERGITQAKNDSDAWTSGWFWFLRR